MSDAFRNAAIEWAKRGFRVFPLRENSKVPLRDSNWTQDATSCLAEVYEAWTDYEGDGLPYNIGVLCEGLLVVDVDSPKAEKAGRGAETIVAYFDLDAPETLTVRTPSGGRHYYFTGPQVPQSNALGAFIDVRSHRGYVVAPGSVVNGVAYTVEIDAEVQPAPDNIVQKMGAAKPKDDRTPVVDLDQDNAKALARHWLGTQAPLAIEGQGGNNTTYDVANRLKDFGLSETTAFEFLAEHWNDRCSPPWSAPELERVVSNAYRYGRSAPGAASPALAFAEVHIPRPDSKLQFLHEVRSARPSWLVKGLLPKTGVGLLAGQSRVGKTFLAIDLARALTSESEFFGCKVKERVGVLFLCAEAAGSFWPRLDAARMHKMGPGTKAEDLPILSGALNHVRDAAACIQEAKERLAEEHPGVRLGLVVIDTIAAAFQLKDENDNAEAAYAMKGLEALAQSHGVNVLGIHHFGKNAEAGVRGAAAWTGGADYILAATATIDESKGTVKGRKLALTKARDGEERQLGAFELRQVAIGEDEDGDPVTSAIVMQAPPSTAASAKRAKLAPAAKVVLQCIEDLEYSGEGSSHIQVEGNVVTAVDQGVVMDRFSREWTSTESEASKRRAFYRAVQVLTAERYVRGYEASEVQKYLWTVQLR